MYMNLYLSEGRSIQIKLLGISAIYQS